MFLEPSYTHYRTLRQSEIIAIPVGQEEEVASGGDEEVKTEAQEMTEIINEVNVEPDEQTVEETQFVEVSKPKAKARAKKAPTKPPEFVEPVVEVSTSLDEVVADVHLPTADELKMETKVSCPDCGKQMSAKTLRYSHGPNCVARKPKQCDFDPNVTEEVIENGVQKRLHNSRAQRPGRRQETVEKLTQNAF